MIGKLFGLELIGVGAGIAPVEIHFGVGAFEFEFFLVEVARVVIGGVQAALGTPGAPRMEAGDQIEDGVLMLPDGEMRELDAGGFVAHAGVGRVESVVDIRGDFGGVVGGAFVVGVVGHCFVDELRELDHGFIAGERIGVAVGDAFS